MQVILRCSNCCRTEIPSNNRGEEMSKKPKIHHDYHAGKDKLKITMSGMI